MLTDKVIKAQEQYADAVRARHTALETEVKAVRNRKSAEKNVESKYKLLGKALEEKEQE